MPQLTVHRPLDESHLHHDLRMYPVRTKLRQALGSGERRLWDLDRIESLSEIQEQLRIEAGADLSREHEVVSVVIANEQGTQTDARTLRIGEAADDELLRGLAFHLEPVLRAAVLVGRSATLGD